MSGINATYLLAALLLIAGILGFIAAANTGTALFNLGGFLLVLISLAMFIGEALGQARHARTSAKDSQDS